MKGFKNFLLFENKAYLGQKVGDILTSLKEINADSKTMGSRDLVRFSERIANQIRRILHSHWSKEEKQYLIKLQKVAVAIMKAIEEKNDLPNIIANSTTTLEKLVADLGVPIHKFASPDKEESEKEMSTSPPEKNKSSPPQQPIVPANPPASPSLDMNVPPLAGNNTGQLTNM
jgi:hypothetical protein